MDEMERDGDTMREGGAERGDLRGGGAGFEVAPWIARSSSPELEEAVERTLMELASERRWR